VTSDDLIEFGMIPEFVGRLPVLAPLDPLDEEAMIRILTEPKNALVKQYMALLSTEGVTMRFTDGAISRIADVIFGQPLFYLAGTIATAGLMPEAWLFSYIMTQSVWLSLYSLTMCAFAVALKTWRARKAGRQSA